MIRKSLSSNLIQGQRLFSRKDYAPPESEGDDPLRCYRYARRSDAVWQQPSVFTLSAACGPKLRPVSHILPEPGTGSGAKGSLASGSIASGPLASARTGAISPVQVWN